MRPRHLKVVICINHTSNLRIIRFTFTGLRSDHYLALSDPDSLHYRLRWPLGRFLSQKNVQSKDSFFSEKRYIGQNKVIFEKVMTQIFDPKNCSKYLENKIFRYNAKRFGKARRGPQSKLICVVRFLSGERRVHFVP